MVINCVELILKTGFTTPRSLSAIWSPVTARTARIPSLCAPSRTERKALIFLSRQQICGKASIPHSRCILAEQRTGSIFTCPRGESEIVTISAPTSLRRLAPFISLFKSVPYGGSSSAAITKSLFAIREENGAGEDFFVSLISIFSKLMFPLSFSERSLMCSGSVPQQPPRIFMLFGISLAISSTKCSVFGEKAIRLLSRYGYPLFGKTAVYSFVLLFMKSLNCTA